MQRRIFAARTVRALGFGVLASLTPLAASAVGTMRITEWMYSGDEFVEFTNVGDQAMSLVGWSYDDDSRTPGSVLLDAFGSVDPGESVILSEADAADFRTAWSLGSQVSVIGGNTVNLGRSDEINLFDSSGTLVDRLTYSDQSIGGPRTQNQSANILPANLGANRADLALASISGDAFASVLSSSGYPGNPGVYVPESETAALVAVGILVLAGARRGRVGSAA